MSILSTTSLASTLCLHDGIGLLVSIILPGQNKQNGALVLSGPGRLKCQPWPCYRLQIFTNTRNSTSEIHTENTKPQRNWRGLRPPPITATHFFYNKTHHNYVKRGLFMSAKRGSFLRARRRYRVPVRATESEI